jgi:hypothetical protein
MKIFRFIFILTLLFPCGIAGQNQAPLVSGGSLSSLIHLQSGKSGRISSADPLRSSNRDMRQIMPGAKLIIADIKGSGMIRHIWMTFPAPAPSWLGKNGCATHSELVIRMYWDGSEQPAVESPVGDFFAAGFGKRAEVNSIPVMVEGGDAYNCFWLMPFYRSARIEIENQSDKPSGSFYYQVDYVQEELPPETPYFCAQYRQEFPVASGRDYLILDAEGEGHYVGTVLSGRARSPKWFGEGDEKFYVDGDKKPTIQGTGTEDYALNAWGMGTGCYPFFGVPILDGEWEMVGWKTTIYRWHIPDPISFKKSLRFEIEDTGWMSEDELAEGTHPGHVERNDDFSSVAFWYQTRQPKRFTTLPPAKERILPNIDLVIEGKELMKQAASTDRQSLSLQKGYEWTGDGQVFINNEGSNDGKGYWCEFLFDIHKEEYRQLTLRMTKSFDYGIYRIWLDGKSVRDCYDFFGDETETVELNLGQHTLPTGQHLLRFECLGKRAESQGSKLGFDSVRLRERWPKKRQAPQDNLY